MSADEQRLLAMCDAEFGWQVDDFIAATRAVVPSLIAERDSLVAVARAVDAALAGLEDRKPHIPPSDHPDRMKRLVQRSTLNLAIRHVRAALRTDEPLSPESAEDEHFPWHYTEFGVVCACGESMRNEVCPAASSTPDKGQR